MNGLMMRMKEQILYVNEWAIRLEESPTLRFLLVILTLRLLSNCIINIQLEVTLFLLSGKYLQSLLLIPSSLFSIWIINQGYLDSINRDGGILRVKILKTSFMAIIRIRFLLIVLSFHSIFFLLIESFLCVLAIWSDIDFMI